jgi:carbohydrate-selective porin OprB
MFGTFVVADGRTNKSGAVLTLGIGGHVPFEKRRRDRFGIAYSQDGVSFPYRDQAKPVELNSENVFESFYSVALTPFIAVTMDLQVIRPMLVRSGVALLPGVRTVIAF